MLTPKAECRHFCAGTGEGGEDGGNAAETWGPPCARAGSWTIGAAATVWRSCSLDRHPRRTSKETTAGETGGRGGHDARRRLGYCLEWKTGGLLVESNSYNFQYNAFLKNKGDQATHPNFMTQKQEGK
jgi:hypothetical protein